MRKKLKKQLDKAEAEIARPNGRFRDRRRRFSHGAATG